MSMGDAFVTLEDERRWLVWRPAERNGRVTKVPCDIEGNPIGGTDPANWLTRLEAEGYIRELATNGITAGLGIALGDLGDDHYLAGIDLDSSLDRGGMPFMITQEMRDRLLGLGYTADDIRNLTPQQANEIIAPNGRIEPWAAEILDVLGTYAEISPSGNGLKAFFFVAAHMVRAFLDRIGVAAGSWGTKRGIPGFVER
jgi:putative DNA primase/helicase